MLPETVLLFLDGIYHETVHVVEHFMQLVDLLSRAQPNQGVVQCPNVEISENAITFPRGHVLGKGLLEICGRFLM